MKCMEMEKFSQPCNTVNEAGFFVLSESYEVALRIEGAKKVFIVPQGFTYDGASIPQAAWSILGLYPDGRLRGSATFHDWLYRNGGKVLSIGNMPYFFKRAEADHILKLMLKAASVGLVKRNLIWMAVRIFGRLNWSK